MMSDQEEEINVLDYWRVLVKRRRLILSIVGIAFLASIGVSLILPKIYAAKTSILPPQKDSTLGPLMGSGLSDLPMGGMGLASGLLGMATPVDLWVGILKSNSILDAIIDQFDLKTLYDKPTRDETRTELGRNIKIVKGKEGIIAITVEDKDPERAAQMANAFVHELDKINQKQIMSTGRRTRVFVEQRLAEAKEELSHIEEAVKTFQETNKAVKLDDQSKAIIGAIGEVKGTLMAKKVELQTLLSFATENHPQAEILSAEVEGLEERLRELVEGKRMSEKPSPKDIFIPTAKIPDLGLQYARLLRKAKVQETLHTLLTQQYEMARIQEVKDSPTVQVLDVAKVPEKKTRPKRALIVILSTLTSGFLSVFIAFFMEFLEKNRSKNLLAEEGDKHRLPIMKELGDQP